MEVARDSVGSPSIIIAVSRCAHGDPDGDGATNYQEFVAGTDPKQAGSLFRFTRAVLANGNVRVTWSSVANKIYDLYGSTNVLGPYVFSQTVPSAGDGETSLNLTAAQARQFYRVRVR